MTVSTDRNDVRGIVFDIQRYSVHDGPGIRTVVFLKGCPLRCQWCANPESQTNDPQLFYIRSRCMHCGQCVAACVDGSLTLKDNGLEIKWESANRGKIQDWAERCPTGALSVKGESMTVKEVTDIVARDELFYRKSGGGMTLSGGEPLLQADFAIELVKAAKGQGISTAIETCGYVPWEILMAVKPFVSLFLYDFKHPDENEHIKYTGVSNRLILKNLEELAASGANIIVRMPLIPGVNDTVPIVRQMVALLKGYGIHRFDLLPFHQLGKAKYDSIGKSYDLKNLSPPIPQNIDRLRTVILDAGLQSK